MTSQCNRLGGDELRLGKRGEGAVRPQQRLEAAALHDAPFVEYEMRLAFRTVASSWLATIRIVAAPSSESSTAASESGTSSSV